VVERPGGRRDHGRSATLDGDAGSSLISTWAGVLVFLAFLLLSVQVLTGLAARSFVTAAMADHARRLAGDRVDHDDPTALRAALADGEAALRRDLGAMGETAHIDWDGSDAEQIVLHVSLESPRFGLPGLSGPLATDHIDRTVRVRVERLR
jgi:hypothetical protein